MSERGSGGGEREGGRREGERQGKEEGRWHTVINGIITQRIG